jgi:hypothetical protein
MQLYTAVTKILTTTLNFYSFFYLGMGKRFQVLRGTFIQGIFNKKNTFNKNYVEKVIPVSNYSNTWIVIHIILFVLKAACIYSKKWGQGLQR